MEDGRWLAMGTVAVVAAAGLAQRKGSATEVWIEILRDIQGLGEPDYRDRDAYLVWAFPSVDPDKMRRLVEVHHWITKGGPIIRVKSEREPGKSEWKSLQKPNVRWKIVEYEWAGWMHDEDPDRFEADDWFCHSVIVDSEQLEQAEHVLGVTISDTPEEAVRRGLAMMRASHPSVYGRIVKSHTLPTFLVRHSFRKPKIIGRME
jgi:hypothetical protein